MNDYIDNNYDIARALFNYYLDMDACDYMDDIDMDEYLDNVVEELIELEETAPLTYKLIFNTVTAMLNSGDSSTDFVLGIF